MFRLVARQLQANPVRFVLTTVGVALAVSFTVSALVIRDGHRQSLTAAADLTTTGVDLEVRPSAEPTRLGTFPPGVVTEIGGIDGVASAVGSIEAPWNTIDVADANGDPINTDGRPRIAYSWSDNGQLNAFTLVNGTAPSLGEFVVDVDSAADHDLVVGETYRLATPSGSASFVLSGTSSYGPDNETLGALLVHFDADEAGRLLGVDGFDRIVVAVDDQMDPGVVGDRIAAVVPGAIVVDRETAVADARGRYQNDFTAEGTMLGDLLLGFAAVSLFVSAFIVYNTFAVTLAQRTQELGLLRTIGGSPAQLRRMVIGEAVVVGALSSAIGIPGGLAIARGIEALFNATGDDMPPFPTAVAGPTIVAALAVGIGVTILAAVRPAWAASTMPAGVAMRRQEEASAVRSRAGLATGLGSLFVGLTLGTIGLLASSGSETTAILMALGAIGTFTGAMILAPTVVGAVVTLISWPLERVLGTPSRIAKDNAARNPRRTATTAAALVVGIALVTAALVIGQSVKSTMGQAIEDSIRADYYIDHGGDGATLPLDAPTKLSASGVVEAVAGFRFIETRVAGSIGATAAADFEEIAAVYETDFVNGSYGDLIDHPALIMAEHAERTGLGPGDVVAVEFPGDEVVEATITGTYRGNPIFGTDYLFDESVYDSGGDRTGYAWIALNVSDGLTDDRVQAALVDWRGALPGAEFNTPAQLRDRVDGVVDEALVVVNFLMALAVVIALIGIANTMALSMLERTRELGLVRAVGMSRRQLRRMVRYEAALVATFGAVIGVLLGLLFGSAGATAMPDHYASTVAIPGRSIVILIMVAALAGVAAAALPARRASRIDMLDAIAT